jgi:hypothetical protein
MPRPLLKNCPGLHGLLRADEITGMGAHVSCLVCGDSFHASEAHLHNHYYHALAVMPGQGESDINFFILATLHEER